MDGDMEISLDRLPIKRLESIEENGAERFPSDVGYDDKRVSLIRRIDFAWALQEEDELKQKHKKQKQKHKKQKKSSEEWEWKGMVENLQLAHQELSIIIDLINTVRVTLENHLFYWFDGSSSCSQLFLTVSKIAKIAPNKRHNCFLG